MEVGFFRNNFTQRPELITALPCLLLSNVGRLVSLTVLQYSMLDKKLLDVYAVEVLPQHVGELDWDPAGHQLPFLLDYVEGWAMGTTITLLSSESTSFRKESPEGRLARPQTWLAP